MASITHYVQRYDVTKAVRKYKSNCQYSYRRERFMTQSVFLLLERNLLKPLGWKSHRLFKRLCLQSKRAVFRPLLF